MPQKRMRTQNGGLNKLPKSTRNSDRDSWSGIVSFMLLVAALLTSSSCFIYVIVKITDIHRGNELTVPEGTYLNVCMNCLRLDPYNLSVENTRVLTKRKVDGVLQCCAESPQQWSAMLNVIAGGHNKVPDSSFHKNLNSTRVSAHMKVSSDKVIDTEGIFGDEYKSVFTFNPVNNNKWRDHASGVAVLDKGLVILRTGPYFIYSSVSYHQRRPMERKKWFSYVHRFSPTSVNSTGVLLKSIHTACVDCKEDFKTMYTGGVFHLRVGDFIQVFLSENDQVASAAIGLVLIGANEKK